MHEAIDESLQGRALDALVSGDTEQVFNLLQPALKNAPSNLAVRTVIVEAVNRIILIEERRGEISRAARSTLAPAAKPYQDLIDRIFYAMAGLSASESANGSVEVLTVELNDITVRQALNAIARAHGSALWSYTERRCGSTAFSMDFLVQ